MAFRELLICAAVVELLSPGAIERGARATLHGLAEGVANTPPSRCAVHNTALENGQCFACALHQWLQANQKRVQTSQALLPAKTVQGGSHLLLPSSSTASTKPAQKPQAAVWPFVKRGSRGSRRVNKPQRKAVNGLFDSTALLKSALTHTPSPVEVSPVSVPAPEVSPVPPLSKKRGRKGGAVGKKTKLIRDYYDEQVALGCSDERARVWITLKLADGSERDVKKIRRSVDGAVDKYLAEKRANLE